MLSAKVHQVQVQGERESLVGGRKYYPFYSHMALLTPQLAVLFITNPLHLVE